MDIYRAEKDLAKRRGKYPSRSPENNLIFNNIPTNGRLASDFLL